jgi:hypothetical protein
MQPCVVGLKVAREPGFKPRAESFIVNVLVVLDVVHDVPNLIQQPLMVGLVHRERIRAVPVRLAIV